MSQPLTAPTYGTYRWFCRPIGRYLEIGEDYMLWSSSQEATVQEIIDSALMCFYYPPAVELQTHPHEWSFLRPTGSLSTTAGAREQLLPPTVERIDGCLTYHGDDEDYPNVQQVGEQRVRQLAYQSEYQSQPAFFCVRPKPSDNTDWQDQEIVFHPTPDSAYTLKYRYHARPIRLSDSFPYPLGGELYAEAIKACCLAEAEKIKVGKPGPEYGHMLNKLKSAIAADLRRGPDLLGYNGDASVLSSNRLNKDIRRLRDYLYTEVTYDS